MKTTKEIEPLLPTGGPVVQRRHPSRVLLLLVIVLLPTTLFLLSSQSSPLTAPGPRTPISSSCPVQPDARNVGNDWKPADDKKFVKLSVERLQGAIQIPTQSYDDMGVPGEDKRFEPLIEFGEYLEATFPLLHDALKLEKVAVYGRFYTWEGTDSSLKPVVLMAHQDVVPVNPDTVDRWAYPPFSGFQDSKGWIWGRGGTDCKNTLIGILAAIEQLLSEGFTPQRTIILSFGFDEEIGGSRSAQPLAQAILARYGPNGIALILDEGFTGVDKAYGQTFARFGMAEKGAISMTVSVLTSGGHSSVPQRHTGIGILSKLMVALEENPFPVALEGNPMLDYLNCAAEYGDMEKGLKKKIEDPKKWKALGEELAANDDVMRAFLGTTQAIDLVSGGIKVNALPELSTATINYRIDFQSSTDETFSHVEKTLAPVVAAYNLTFSVAGSAPDVTNSVVRLDRVPTSLIEPAPLTSSHGPAWDLMGGTAKTLWEDAVLVPSGMVANTDTKWTWALTKNIFRFAPTSLELLRNFHTVDERIHVDAHISSIRFFYKLIRNTEGWESE